MVRLIPKSKSVTLTTALVSLFISCTYAQSSSTAQCAVTSMPTQVRAEGLTEPLGNIVFECTGYTPSAVIAGNLTLFFPVHVTHRIDSNNNAIDAVLLLDTGAGFTPTATPGTIAGHNITFQGLSVTVPASGRFNLEISNV